MITYPKYKVAAAQIAPVWLDLDASVDKAVDFIHDAAQNGAKLIAFPESYLPGYPWWILFGDPIAYGLKYWHEFYQNAVEIPGKAVSKLSAAARDNNIYVCISVTEKDGGSLYLSQLWFNNKGDLINKHRKVRPTITERTIWGEGDGSMMKVVDTELGRLGGLHCWEHKMVGNLWAMASQNEQVHVAAWPAGNGIPDSLFCSENIEVDSKYYAGTNGTFVLASTHVVDQYLIDRLGGNIPQPLGMGHSMIINPHGFIISEPLPHDQEGNVYADIDLNMIIDCKYFIDPAGHYSKPEVCRMLFNNNPLNAVTPIGSSEETFLSADVLTKVKEKE